jgi:hypothetical protein
MSIVGLFLVAQAAVPMAAQSAPPDIEIRAHADIRSVKIRSQGRATVTLHADPGVSPPVEVVRSAPAGQASYRNLTIDLHGIARLTPPAPIAAIDTTTTGDSE